MRTRYGTIVATAAVALAAGVAAGWFAAGLGNCGIVELCNSGIAESDNAGRGGAPVSPEQSESRKRSLEVCGPDGRAARPLAAGNAPEAGLEARAEKAGFSNEDAESIAESFRAIAEADMQVY